MPVTCPSCHASYRLERESLAPGRRLRCSRCRAEWFAGGPPAPIASLEDAVAIDAVDMVEALANAPPQVDPDEDDGLSPTRPPRRRLRLRWPGFRRARAKLTRSARPEPASRRPASSSQRLLPRLPRVRPVALFVAVGLGALAAGLLARVEVVRAAPALASLYSAVGLPVNVRGLAIRDLRSVEAVEEGVPILLVTGAVENLSPDETTPPRLRLAVEAGDGRELYAWTTVAARASLAPGETSTFRARLASPPAEGRAIAVRFLARRDLAGSTGR